MNLQYGWESKRIERSVLEGNTREVVGEWRIIPYLSVNR